MEFFVRGVLIGLLLAIPVGPTMVLCVRYTIAFGFLMGVVTGIGSGLADAIYGVFAGYGVYVVRNFMHAYSFVFHLIGSGILCYLGIKTYFEQVSTSAFDDLSFKPKAFRLFLTTFVLTLTSPLTVVGVSALCAALGVGDLDPSPFSPWILSLGLFVGSCIWWQFLSILILNFRKKISNKGRNLVGKVSGAVLFLLGFSLFIYAISLKFNV